MYKHILIPTDGSPTADKAVAGGIEFAREANARVTFFTAMPGYRLPGESESMARYAASRDAHERRSRARAGAILAGAGHRARAVGLEFSTAYSLSDQPYQAIIDAAKRNRCDAVFMASHGRTGLSALWHGSETREVLTHSTIPTLVYR